MAKQSSSVEWLFEELFNSFEKFNNGEYSFAEYMAHNLKLRQQAKAMHKQELMQALNDGKAMVLGSIENKSLEQYYNETFGGNNE